MGQKKTKAPNSPTSSNSQKKAAPKYTSEDQAVIKKLNKFHETGKFKDINVSQLLMILDFQKTTTLGQKQLREVLLA